MRGTNSHTTRSILLARPARKRLWRYSGIKSATRKPGRWQCRLRVLGRSSRSTTVDALAEGVWATELRKDGQPPANPRQCQSADPYPSTLPNVIMQDACLPLRLMGSWLQASLLPSSSTPFSVLSRISIFVSVWLLAKTLSNHGYQNFRCQLR